MSAPIPADAILLPRELVEQALNRVVEAMLRPDEIERRIEAEVERRLGTVSLEEAARMAGWEPRPFLRMCKRKGLMAVTFSSRKQRFRVVDVERFITDHIAPLNKRRRRPAGAQDASERRAA